MRAAKRLRGGPPACLLVATVALIASLAAAAASRSPSATKTNPPARTVRSAPGGSDAGTNDLSLPALPPPAPARRADLPGAFTKTVPGSVADLRVVERHIKTLATRLSPTVVAVEIGAGTGSGVVVSADGLVLTAGHVCGRAGRTARFTFPTGKKARGKTLGVDLESDTGFLRITDRGPWPYAVMGDLKQARIGDWVLALGHPGGFDQRRSLVVRSGRIIELAGEALQTDCAIGPGDSGGPLFDMHGRVIGIHSAISASVADNFHVAITEFYSTREVLARGAE